MQIANGGVLPSFSKYSGVLEWSNCIFLWVNLEGASGYDNNFSQDGRFVTWFGGSRMHKGMVASEVVYRYDGIRVR